MIKYHESKLCNRIAKISESACAVGVCKEFAPQGHFRWAV